MKSSRRSFSYLMGLAVAMVSPTAFGQSTLRWPGEHPDYVAEIEPHLVLGLFGPPGAPVGTGIGGGVRASLPLVKNGFIPNLNNSVALTFGVDWVHYEGQTYTAGRCGSSTVGPGGTSVCTSVDGPIGGPSNYLYVPVGMQWNFWIAQNFSAFAEPGIAAYYEKARYESSAGGGLTPLFQLGGRWHFFRRAMLTLRVGYPTLSLGVSMIF